MTILRFYVRTFLFLFVTVVLAPFYFLILLTFYKWRGRIGPRIVQFYSKICLFIYRVHIEEIKNSVLFEKNRRGILIVANHTSFLDIFVLSAVFGSVFISKSEVKYYPVIGQIAWLMGVIFLERDSSKERLRVLKTIANECPDKILVVFPQGTTSGSTERLPFNRGVFKVVELNPDVSLLPVSVYYKEETEIAWSKPQTLKENAIRVSAQRKIYVKLVIHNLITMEDYREKTAQQICRMAEQTVLEPLQGKYDEI
ncbi:MAG: lysophospholipid acyltransferase family protein [Nitrospirota bacterium]